MKTFRVNGVLFGVTDDKKLAVFTPNFDNVYALNGMGGLWETISDIGTSIKDGVVTVYDNISSGAKSLLTTDTIKAAASIATGILGYKLAKTQLKLQNAGAFGPQLPAGAGDLNYPSGGLPPGFSPRIDTTTMLLLGGGALLLVFALRK